MKFLYLFLSLYASFLLAQDVNLDILNSLSAEQRSSIMNRVGVEETRVINPEDQFYRGINSNQYSNLVKQINRVQDTQEYEDYNKEVRDKRVELAIKLCQLDPQSCYLIDNYNKYIASKRPDNIEDLELFGVDFFSGYPLSFNQVELGSFDPDYTLKPNDSVRVRYIGTSINNVQAFINQDGKIFLNEFGSISIAGLSFLNASNAIESFIKSKSPVSEVYVTIDSIQNFKVFTVGAVRNPGSYNISASSKALNAIIASGGFSNISSLRKIEVIRNDQLIREIDLYEFLIDGKSSSDISLQSNDRIVVPPLKNKVSIIGSVNRPAIYEFKKGETVKDLINFSLGMTATADIHNITLQRSNQFGQKESLNISIDSGIQLQENDVVIVNDAVGDSINYISLNGAIRNSGIHAYKPGIKLNELVNRSRDFLEKTYPAFVIIKRFNTLTRSWKLISIDLTLEERFKDFSLEPKDNIYFLSYDDIEFINSKAVIDYLKIDPATFFSQINSSNEDNSNSYQEDFSCLSSLKNFGDDSFASKAVLKLNLINDYDLQTCTSIFNENPEILPYIIEQSIPILGQIRKPALYPITSYSSARELIDIAGGIILSRNSKIKVLYKINSSNEIISHELSKLSNIEDSDIVFLSVQDINYEQKESFVTILGEVRFPGTYAINEFTKISEVFQLAGGLNTKAYPLGSILSRESIKVKEQDALKRAENELTDILASAVTSGVIQQNPADLMPLVSLMSDIGNARPVGRLVTELNPTKLSRDPSLDIFLEPGDTIFVPRLSNTVTVVGSVLNPITLPFSYDISIREYIKMAGGYKDYAEPDKTYVLLPNGISVPANSFFGLGGPDILPGSTIIVPRNARPLSGFAFAEAISPILANLSISLASINSITNN